MLYCVKCGSSVAEGTTLCLKCGTPVTGEEPRTTAEAQTAQSKKYSAMPQGYGHHVRLWFPVVLGIVACAALFAAVRMNSDPYGIGIVKRHFV